MSRIEEYHPLLLCFAGPAASGKTTICSRLAELDPWISVSISTTTRQPRPGEQTGVHYHFVSEAEFSKRVQNERFLEYARFGENLYGTEIENLEQAKTSGKDLILDIDMHGVRQLKQKYPEQTVCIFVFPPSMDVLRKRLEERGTETPESIASRLEIAEKEIDTLRDPMFSQYLLINDELEEAVLNAWGVVRAERMRLTRSSERRLNDLLGKKG